MDSRYWNQRCLVAKCLYIKVVNKVKEVKGIQLGKVATTCGSTPPSLC